ncbi:hypothetical protein IHE44_0012701 [Lamprotornis superbus]|uniref:Uncharacterized protein n=1 Tax=Lamprotornis superbus TaxID=245042 RepID=A0A835TQN9_9PASS|nr:hypothetical protein IHE44_0012701 [Lamprotornis superbus]
MRPRTFHDLIPLIPMEGSESSGKGQNSLEKEKNSLEKEENPGKRDRIQGEGESCARVLLFRGASKEIRNYNSQTAFQVSRIPGNPMELPSIPTAARSRIQGFFQDPNPTPLGASQDLG